MATYKHHGLIQKRKALNPPGEYILYILFNPEEPNPQKIQWSLKLSNGQTGTAAGEWVQTSVLTVGAKKVHHLKIRSAPKLQLDSAPEIGDLVVTIFQDPNPKSVPAVIID